MLKWLATQDGRLLLLSLAILACFAGLWQSILNNRAETIKNRLEVIETRRASDRNFEALQRLERAVAEMGN